MGTTGKVMNPSIQMPKIAMKSQELKKVSGSLSGNQPISRLAEHYWDLNDPAYRKVLDSWLSAPEAFCLMTLTPTKIRNGG